MIPQYSSALLISDLHLTPSMPLTAQRFFDFCEKDGPKVEAVFILGDLFEYWVGDDAASSSPFQQEVRHALANLSTKVDTFYIHGNRDFLVGADFLKKTGKDTATITTETIHWFDQKWKELHERMEIVPGKQILRMLRDEVQRLYSVNLTDIRIIDEFTCNEVPNDLVVLIRKLEAFRIIAISDL